MYKFEKEKTIVLGASGYIGSFFVEKGYNGFNYRSYEIDLTKLNLKELDFYLKEYTTIINCVGFCDTKASELPENFRKVIEINSNFVKTLSDYCDSYDKKLVHLSTGDLYNSFNWNENVEENIHLDTNTNYRLSKRLGEKYCSENSLILRIRLPFCGRNHPRNLIHKVQNYKNFYHWTNSYTFLPDLIKATEILLENNQCNCYSIVQYEAASILYLMRNVLKLEHLQHIDMHDKSHPNLITELDNVHIHNDINTEKLRKYFIQTPLETAWVLAYNQYLENVNKDLTVSKSDV